MSTGEPQGSPNNPGPETNGPGPESDSVASKLSKELSNWRRKRTSPRPGRHDGPAQTFQSEPARTIKVRGHETLVVRKPKLTSKPSTDQSHTPSNH
ncbi:MAG TPA: hypothetical protein VMU16_08175 [Candidatus Binataceae bacterium]|nr:hypothetical protein [Candidatus Binataceae bacterium]